MTLEFEKFQIFAEEFLSLSLSFGDQWVLKNTNSDKKDIYLEKRCTLPISRSQNSENIGDNGVITQNLFCVFVYHIIYSHSYSVPVLYFNAYHANGKLLTLEEIWKEIPECYQSSIESNKWNMITQQEHPKLGIPYFMVHPCYTSDFMSCCSSSNYLITWLSIIGPVVGIPLLFEYAKHIKPVKKL